MGIHWTSTVRKWCWGLMSRMLRQVRRAALVGAIGEKKLVVQKKKKSSKIRLSDGKKVLKVSLKFGELEMNEAKYWLETLDIWPRIFRGRRRNLSFIFGKRKIEGGIRPIKRYMVGEFLLPCHLYSMWCTFCIFHIEELLENLSLANHILILTAAFGVIMGDPRHERNTGCLHYFISHLNGKVSYFLISSD